MKKNQSHKPFYEAPESLVAKGARTAGLHSKSFKNAEGHTIKNISVEDWDCPRPGQKHYMPRKVKDNIRKNMQKIKSLKHASDSLRHNASTSQ